MTVYHVRIHDDADRRAVIEDLRLQGEVREFSAIPKLLEWEGRADAEADLMRIPGVRSVERDDPQKMRPMSTHALPYGMLGVPGQLAIVYHGQKPGSRLFASAYDFAAPPGQAAVFDYDPTAGGIGDGTGVNIYVVDSGVDEDHPEWAGRFGSRLYDAYSGDPLGFHGSACAACAAGTNLGIAPGATLYDARSFPTEGSVSSSTLIAGMNDCLDHFIAGSTPGVMSCSFGGNASSDAYSTVIDACVDAGLPVVVAAGNDSRHLGATGGSLNVWPAENPDAITVGATDQWMRLIPFTNRGGQTDLYAMGHAWNVAMPDGTYRGSMITRGTSFSCPMTAGVVARMLTGTTKMTSRAEVDAVKADLLDNYTVEGVYNESGTPRVGDRRLWVPGVTFTGFQAHTPPVRGVPENAPITVDFARTRVVLGSRSDGVTVRRASAHAVLGSRSDAVSVRLAKTHVVIQE